MTPMETVGMVTHNEARRTMARRSLRVSLVPNPMGKFYKKLQSLISDRSNNVHTLL